MTKDLPGSKLTSKFGKGFGMSNFAKGSAVGAVKTPPKAPNQKFNQATFKTQHKG